jgi:hypothetical protein
MSTKRNRTVMFSATVTRAVARAVVAAEVDHPCDVRRSNVPGDRSLTPEALREDWLWHANSSDRSPQPATWFS